MGARMFDDDELAALVTPHRDRVAGAIERLATAEDADPDARAALVSTVEDVERQQQRFVSGFHQFVAAIQEWLAGEDADPLTALTALDRSVHESVLVDIEAYGAAGPSLESGGATAIAELAAAGRAADALDRFDRRQDQLRRLHDLAVDRVAAALTYVYRTYGVDRLEACLRHCGRRTLLAWMPHDLVRPLDVRIRHWVKLGLANFATLRVEEFDDEIVLVQDPCGTCSRQVLQGAYAPPLDFAVVEEAHPITWNRGSTPVYRTHVAVMHDLMPREEIGEPWPRIECPAGVSAGPCRQHFRKT